MGSGGKHKFIIVVKPNNKSRKIAPLVNKSSIITLAKIG